MGKLLPKYKMEEAKRLKRNEKISKRRKIEIRPIKISFLIVCEGTKTEPLYFQALLTNRTSEIREVQIDGAGRGTVSLVKHAISIRNGSDKDFDRVWIVFDKDSFTDFNNAIKLANDNNILCAWSNESFELWYYLHFHYLDNEVSRDQYITMLEREFQNRIGDPSFRYQKKNPNIYSLLQKYGNEEQAIKHAKKLRSMHRGKNYATHKPCTTVDILVQELKNPELLL